ncbi:MAG: hypothetical protein H6849_02130 [Alphaproteobacteria bacterium]|nr:MAG: hypothetical protein H6849_02130 [Alphaproteobacteria bacterium]
MRKILSFLNACVFIFNTYTPIQAGTSSEFNFPVFYASVQEANKEIRVLSGVIANTAAEKRRDISIQSAISFSKKYLGMLKQLPKFSEYLQKNSKNSSVQRAATKYRFIDHELSRMNEEYYKAQAEKEFEKGGKLDLYKYLLTMISTLENAGTFSKEHANLTYHGVMGIVFIVHELYRKFEDVSGRDPKLEKRINTAIVKFLRRAL